MVNNITYITYADGEYYTEMSNSIFPQTSSGFDNSILYKKFEIDPIFYEKNKKILDSKTGAGYWIWKPYFILNTLMSLGEGDIVFYLDLGDRISSEIKNFIKDKTIENGGFFLVEGLHQNSLWTKGDCFSIMGCEEERYKTAKQLEAGCCAFLKNDLSLKFVKEWIEYCQNYDVIASDCKGDNIQGFIEHRWDQSILTNLCIKYNIRTVPIETMYRYISYNNFF